MPLPRQLTPRRLPRPLAPRRPSVAPSGSSLFHSSYYLDPAVCPSSVTMTPSALCCLQLTLSSRVPVSSSPLLLHWPYARAVLQSHSSRLVAPSLHLLSLFPCPHLPCLATSSHLLVICSRHSHSTVLSTGSRLLVCTGSSTLRAVCLARAQLWRRPRESMPILEVIS